MEKNFKTGDIVKVGTDAIMLCVITDDLAEKDPNYYQAVTSNGDAATLSEDIAPIEKIDHCDPSELGNKTKEEWRIWFINKGYC